MQHAQLFSLVVLSVWLCGGWTAMAGERVFAQANAIDRDWPRTLLHYDLQGSPGEFREGKTEVVDAQGSVVEHQLSIVSRHPDGSIRAGRLSLYAELPRAQSLQFTLRSAESPKTAPARVLAATKGDVIEVTSDCAGVRLPAPGVRTFNPPANPKDVPAPILGWRLAGGQWAGRTWLESDQQIASVSQRIVADGPLYKEYAYEIRYATQGVYRVRVRVEAELPLVHVAEEYDMGRATAGKDFFVLALNDGWKPDSVMWAADRMPDGRQKKLRERRVEHDSCVWQEPLDFSKDREHSQFFSWGDWGPKALWYCLFAENGAGDSPCVGIMSEHIGAWRLPNQSLSPFLWTSGGQVQARMRTSINLNGAPQNPFSTEEIDPSLPQTLGRRMWSLVLGPRPIASKAKAPNGTETETPIFAAMDFYRSYHGFITLDNYKDWVVRWPEQKDLSRPRGVLTPKQLARLKADIARCPGRDLIQDTYLISGSTSNAIREAREAIGALDSRLNGSLPYFLTHYRQNQFDYQAIFPAESALTCPDLPADLRVTLLAKLAAICYMLTSPDFNPRGAGVHMGNPNMAVNRYMGLPVYATIIQDHPMAKRWLDDAAVYTKWRASYNIASGGGTFRENPGYATYGPSIFLSTAAIALRNAGYDLDRFEPLKDLGRYFRDIDTPLTAPRGMWRQDHLKWLAGRKVRVLPGFGNGADVAGGQTEFLLANLTAQSDPAYASERLGAWEESGAFFGTEQVYPGFWFYWNGELKPKTPARADAMVAGFGGVLRAHSDSPDETCAMLRQGYTQSHWNPDQGTFVLYARGACLCPPTGWGYSGTEGICHDSRICFGQPLADHEHGRVDTNIEDYGSLSSLGYLLGRQTFLKRWDPTKTTLTNSFVWSRQVLLLRSEKATGPNYVVVRDSTQGDCPLTNWWYQWLVAKSDNVKPIAGGVRALTAGGVTLDVVFAEPANHQVTIKGTKVQGFQEDYSQISLSQGPNHGYLTVFYPYGAGEAGPGKIERLAEGVVRVTTPESEDYVFCAADRPVTFTNDTVRIEAYAGAIRIRKDKVLLVNASGRFGAVGYRGVTARGLGPFEESVAVDVRGMKTIETGRKVARVTEPAGGGTLCPVGLGTEATEPGVLAEGIGGWIRVAGNKTTFAAAAGTGRLQYKDFYIKGEAPFVCVHEPGKVTLTAEGRRRVFQMPIPEDIVPPNLLPPRENLPEEFRLNWSVGGWINWPWAISAIVDGASRQAGWYDGLMTVGLDEGRQTATIIPFTNPAVWPENAFTRLLPAAAP